MRILYDHQIYILQNFGGISRYFYELSKGLINRGHVPINSVKYSKNVFVTDDKVYNCKELLPGLDFKGKNKIIRLSNEYKSKKLIEANDYDVFHPTYYNSYFLDSLDKKKPLVVTFHDLIHEKFGNRFPYLSDEKLLHREKLIARADMFIAISEATKKDMIEVYKIDPSKIQVIYHSNLLELDSSNYTQEELGDYILYVGVRKAYKNFEFFISSIAPLLNEEKGLRVICAGGGVFTIDEIKLFESLKITNQLLQVQINDKQLNYLYKKALFFVLPSLYEGFGLPILEAFACSCPVLTSNAGPLPEVGGDAVLYMEPESKENILWQVKAMLNSASLRAQLIEKGNVQLKKFTIERTIEETIKVYKSVL